jgi:hypothetical protein
MPISHHTRIYSMGSAGDANEVRVSDIWQPSGREGSVAFEPSRRYGSD